MPTKRKQLSPAWAKARKIWSEQKNSTLSQLNMKYGAGVVSMAVRAYPRARDHKMLHSFTYRAVCATLSISDSRFEEFMESMDITPDLPVRVIQQKAKLYREKVYGLPEADAIRTDLDYIVLDGRRFWITPEKVSEFKALLEDQIL